MLAKRAQAEFQRVPDRFAADEIAALVCEKLALGDNRSACQRKSKPDEADRLFRGTTAGTGDAGDCQGQTGA